MMADTDELLVEYANLLNKFGPDSEEADDFIELHKENTDFVELAALSKKLKVALTTPCHDLQTCNYKTR